MMMIGLAVRELEGGGKHAASREEVYGIVKRNVSRMGILAQNFLSEARLAAGQSKLTLAPEPLEEIVAGVVASVRPLADDKDISVAWSVVPSDLRASVDRVALGVALTNLVNNALKYTPERGRVAVDVRLREGPPRAASVCVEDTGIGISADDQKRVFSAFERTETGRRTASGYGLGLKLAYDIIKAHGSVLEIESQPGKGSKFSFLLPA
jgi:signal transduction histidine kinase